jgi:hypothetical protein
VTTQQSRNRIVPSRREREREREREMELSPVDVFLAEVRSAPADQELRWPLEYPRQTPLFDRLTADWYHNNSTVQICGGNIAYAHWLGVPPKVVDRVRSKRRPHHGEGEELTCVHVALK